MDTDTLRVDMAHFPEVAMLIAQFNRGLLTLDELSRSVSLLLNVVTLFRSCTRIGMIPYFSGTSGLRLELHYEVD